MSVNRIQKIAIRVIEKQSISCDDVSDIQAVLADAMYLSRDEAETMIRMERMVGQTCEAWGELFVEAVTAHVVWESRPTGRVRGDDAAWLAGCLHQPRVGPARNLGALLIAVVREAEEVDPALVETALAENREPAAASAGLLAGAA